MATRIMDYFADLPDTRRQAGRLTTDYPCTLKQFPAQANTVLYPAAEIGA